MTTPHTAALDSRPARCFERPLWDEPFLRPPSMTPILLALANDDISEAAINMTDALATARNAVPRIVQVFDPSPYTSPPFIPTTFSLAEGNLGECVDTERRQEFSAQIARTCGHPITWPVVSRIGSPAHSIIDEALDHRSSLLVMGLHYRRQIEHVLGAETTIRTMTRAGIPVLAVAKHASGLPRRALVAVDFGASSLRAAHLTARLVQPPGELILAHVQSPCLPFVSREQQQDTMYGDDIEGRFGRLQHELALSPDIVVKTIVLTGDPATAVGKYAQCIKPDLIGVASQRHPRRARLLLGSVSRQIVRSSHCSVFVTPPLPTAV